MCLTCDQRWMGVWPVGEPTMPSIAAGYWLEEPDGAGATWIPCACYATDSLITKISQLQAAINHHIRENYTTDIMKGVSMATKESELYERIMEVLYDVGLLEPVSIDSIADEVVDNYVGYIVGSGRNHSRDDADNFLHAIVADAITQALDAADCGDICACC
jgi:hypothetical protein